MTEKTVCLNTVTHAVFNNKQHKPLNGIWHFCLFCWFALWSKLIGPQAAEEPYSEVLLVCSAASQDKIPPPAQAAAQWLG